MPEIIEFCNIHFYAPFGTPLAAMKQYTDNRLEPLKRVFVEDATMQGDYNQKEAEMIVKQIQLCVLDKSYKNKTIGVITLLGHVQSKKIEEMLMNTIGVEEMEKREIICGNSTSFQGDERDIIFLSMVKCREKSIHAQTTQQDARRYNVAVSRAKEQIWLFHSIQLADLSNNDDFKYKLLDYFSNDTNLNQNMYNYDFSDPDIIPEPFDSKFEVIVYQEIKNKGYKVIPQYSVGPYKIDLVVVLNNGVMIAVECDGDLYHGPEQFTKDMMRQRTLERCGWQFFRIRGSDYYINNNRILNKLWELLEKNSNSELRIVNNFLK